MGGSETRGRKSDEAGVINLFFLILIRTKFGGGQSGMFRVEICSDFVTSP